METRVAIIGIIVENTDSVDALNDVLHEFGNYIIGRMGLPYAKKDVNIISVCLDAPLDTINKLSGKLGMIDGVSAKAVFSKV
ncbi:MAG: iron-only hydrogenase system regulator [Clostridia bacterium]|nr:iron-only hydrogenase system regulator [Clostridia bacterium]